MQGIYYLAEGFTDTYGDDNLLAVFKKNGDKKSSKK